ncbi:MAG: histidine triad nucleotide-binding protein [Fibrobacter sp.]|jgi:histidine triad (HIT) family protein|nr:histidine triad nucleotide-binding protein [Fibrobacter sp.]
MKDCLFCKIASGEIPTEKIYEDEQICAFFDIAPQAKTHFLVIPKKHIANLMELKETDAPLMGQLLYQAEELAKKLGLEENGARFVFNCKEDGGQTVSHIHLHVLGGRKLSWPPG